MGDAYTFEHVEAAAAKLLFWKDVRVLSFSDGWAVSEVLRLVIGLFKTARLHGCKAAWLHGCTAARLQGCTAAKPSELKLLQNDALLVQLSFDS